MIKAIRKYWYLWILLIIGGILAFNFARVKTAGSPAKTYTVKRQNLNEILTLSGQVDADQKANLRFQTSGRLAWVGVKEGDSVKQYQTLASLDQRELQKDLQKELLAYDKTRWSFDQTKDNYQNTIVTDAIKRILEESQFDLNSSVLDVEIQNLALEYSNLVTPISGIVTHIDTPYAGVNITPAGAEFDVVNPTTIYLSVTADQTEVTQIKPGMTADLVFDSYPDEKITGSIKTISFAPKVGESSTVYEVKVGIDTPNDNYRFRLGMTADANFTVKQLNDVLAIPLSYLKDDNGKFSVLKLVGGKSEKTIVSVGAEVDTSREITAGLNEGDSIIEQK